MQRMTSFSWQLTALTLIVFGLGLLLLPEEFSEPLRRTTRDLARPGQGLTTAMLDTSRTGWRMVQEWQARSSEVARLKSDLLSERIQSNELRDRLARLQQQLHDSERQRQAKVIASPSEPLFTPLLIDARVLGQETIDLHRGRMILGAGSANGAGENLLVLDQRQPVLDVGERLGVTVHAPIFAGQAVVGRTVNCGAYSCALQSVTDLKFSGAAQVMRRTSKGLQPGPEGVVEGTGRNRCRLTGVWRREPIEVGDEIYTPVDDPLLPHQMFYGKVVHAELPDGAAHWIVEIEPAALDLRLTRVQILRPQENPIRVLAN